MDGPRYSNQFIFEQPCLKHQLHLLCRDLTRLINKLLLAHDRKYGYFGSVAKICHTWRAHGVKLSKVWQALVPHAWEYKASCHVPPLAVAGRWGSIDGPAAALAGCLSIVCNCQLSARYSQKVLDILN